MTPEPIPKGDAIHQQTGRHVRAFYLKHDADIGETPADDCFITLSRTTDVGLRGSGESGIFPPDEFRKLFKLL